MELTYTPDFQISANDKDITDPIKDAFIQITLTDNSGDKSDDLNLTLDGSKIKTLPNKNAVLKISLGFNDKMYFQGAFVVNEISEKGWPLVVSITATSIPLGGKDYKTSIQSQRTQAWDEVTLGDVLKTVATRNNLKSIANQELANISIDHIDQIGESDLALMTRLAKQFSGVSKVSNESWLLLKEGDGKNASGTKTLSVKEISAHQCTRFTYSSDSRKEIKSSIAKWHNLETGESGVCKSGSGEPAYEILYVYPNKQEAQAGANAQAKKIASGSEKFSCDLPADHQLLNLFAEGMISVTDFHRDAINKKWKVKTINKRVVPQQGITVSISCESGGS